MADRRIMKVIDFSKQKECENHHIKNGRCIHLIEDHKLGFCIERKPYLVCPYFTIKKE